jgi:hypothetical protein
MDKDEGNLSNFRNRFSVCIHSSGRIKPHARRRRRWMCPGALQHAKSWGNSPKLLPPLTTPPGLPAKVPPGSPIGAGPERTATAGLPPGSRSPTGAGSRSPTGAGSLCQRGKHCPSVMKPPQALVAMRSTLRPPLASYTRETFWYDWVRPKRTPVCGFA